MSDRLSDLIITRVAFVPKGDNPGAHVALWKSAIDKDNPTVADSHVDAVIGGKGKIVTPALQKCPGCGKNVSTRKKVCPYCGTSMSAVKKASDEYDALIKRTFTAQQRKDLAAKGLAMKDGSYPIENASDLSNAVSSMGRGNAASSTIKSHIIRVARKLGLTASLPKDWGVTKESWMAARPRDRLRAAVLAMAGADGAGRKEAVVTDTAKQGEGFTLPDDTPEEVRKHVEQLEARVTELQGKDPAPAPTPAPTPGGPNSPSPGNPPVDPIEAALAKEDLDADTRTALEMAKAARSDSEVAKAEVEKLRAEGELRVAVEKASGWKNLTAKPETFGPMLAKLRKDDPATADEVERVLTSANAIASEAMREIGKDGGRAGGDAMEKLKAIAAEIAKSQGIPESVAFVKATETEEGKRLHEEYAKEVAEG